MIGSFRSPKIYIPVLDEEVSEFLVQPQTLHEHTLPDGIFEHKEYPICQCGRKYVPIKDWDQTRCFFCQFTERNPVKTNKPLEKKQQLCNSCNLPIFSDGVGRRRIVCYACAANKIKANNRAWHKRKYHQKKLEMV